MFQPDLCTRDMRTLVFLIILTIGILIAACSSLPSDPSADRTAVPVTKAPPELSQEAAATATSVPTKLPAAAVETQAATTTSSSVTPETSSSQGEGISEDEASDLMSDLLYSKEDAPAALARIVEAGDERLTAVFVELIFSRPGMGTLIYNGIQSRNFPVARSGILVIAFLFVLANLLADLLYTNLDPRIQLDKVRG